MRLCLRMQGAPDRSVEQADAQDSRQVQPHEHQDGAADDSGVHRVRAERPPDESYRGPYGDENGGEPRHEAQCIDQGRAPAHPSDARPHKLADEGRDNGEEARRGEGDESREQSHRKRDLHG